MKKFILSLFLSFLCLSTKDAVATFQSAGYTNPDDLRAYREAAHCVYRIAGGIALGDAQVFEGRTGDTVTPIGCLWQDDAKIKIAFRGTVGLGDWIGNFRANLITDTDTDPRKIEGRVHAGFFGVVQSLLQQVLGIISAAQIEEKELVFTGHSLGGALAILTAAKIKLIHEDLAPNQLKVFAFSAPKIGDIRCKEHIERLIGKHNIVTFASYWDPVTYIPRHCCRPGVTIYYLLGETEGVDGVEFIADVVSLIAKFFEEQPDKLAQFEGARRIIGNLIALLPQIHSMPSDSGKIIDCHLQWRRHLWSGVDPDEVVTSIVSMRGVLLHTAQASCCGY